MFGPMALTVVFALAGSLVCALTLMPVLATPLPQEGVREGAAAVPLAKRVYTPFLGATLRHRFATVATAVALFAASLALIPFLGAEFIPRLDEGSIAMQIWRIPSISLEQSNEISTMAEKVLVKEFPREVDTVVSRTGRAEIATDPMGVEISDTFIILKPKEQWRFESKEALVEAIDEAMKKHVPGAIFSYSQPIELRVQELISGVRSDVAVHLYGDDLTLLKEKADEIARVLQRVPGAADVKAEQTQGLPMLRIRIDRRRSRGTASTPSACWTWWRRWGASRRAPCSTGRSASRSRRASARASAPTSTASETSGWPRRRRTADRRARSRSRSSPSITVEDGPAQISRDRISRRINVEANVRGRDLASFVAEAQAAIDREVQLPPGWTWSGVASSRTCRPPRSVCPCWSRWRCCSSLCCSTPRSAPRAWRSSST
jgi:cobalt-zinc-cadmium resistance protein CzcA